MTPAATVMKTILTFIKNGRKDRRWPRFTELLPKVEGNSLYRMCPDRKLTGACTLWIKTSTCPYSTSGDGSAVREDQIVEVGARGQSKALTPNNPSKAL